MTADELTPEAVFQIAPDAKAAQAGLKLVREGRFSRLRVSPDHQQVGGQCQGSDWTPYDVEVDLTHVRPAHGCRDIGAGCNCMSFKRPCKHCLGLLFAYLETPAQFTRQQMTPCTIVPLSDGQNEEDEADPKNPPGANPTEAREAFERAIFEQPDEDAARLMFADWLQEQGDPYGEFIRIQCELASLPPTDERTPVLQQREQQLLHKHGGKWRKSLPAAVKRMNPQFIRGFVGKVTTTVSLFPRNAAAIFASAPVRSLRLTDFSNAQKVARVAKCPELGSLAELDLVESGLGGSLVEVLIATPYLKSLKTLDLSGNHLGAAGVRAIAEATFLHSLKRLELARCHLGPSAAETLAGAAWLSRLERLNLSGNGLGNDGARVLSKAVSLGELQELRLIDADIGPSGRKLLEDRFGDRVCFHHRAIESPRRGGRS